MYSLSIVCLLFASLILSAIQKSRGVVQVQPPGNANATFAGYAAVQDDASKRDKENVKVGSDCLTIMAGAHQAAIYVAFYSEA